MNITYASEHKWLKSIGEEPLSTFGKNNRARLRSALKNIEETGIRHEIAELTQDTLDWFTPLYNEKISAKDNPKLFDIHATTIGKESKFTYYSLALFEDDTPIGATIFSERNKILSIAYRIFPSQWDKYYLQANPSLYTEYIINKHGADNGFTKLSHGRDRNPYGLNSHIGLAMFKLSVGCSAYLPTTEYQTQTLDTEELTEDVLIFEHPESDRKITKGVLVTTEENLPKYAQITKYPDQIDIETILRK